MQKLINIAAAPWSHKLRKDGGCSKKKPTENMSLLKSLPRPVFKLTVVLQFIPQGKFSFPYKELESINSWGNSGRPNSNHGRINLTLSILVFHTSSRRSAQGLLGWFPPHPPCSSRERPIDLHLLSHHLMIELKKNKKKTFLFFCFVHFYDSFFWGGH